MQPRHEELVQLELLGDDVARPVHARKVPVRSVEVLDQGSLGSAGCRKTIGMGSGMPASRLLRGCDRRVLEGDDDVDTLKDEHTRLRLGLVRLQVPPEELDVLAVGPAQLLELLFQRRP